MTRFTLDPLLRKAGSAILASLESWSLATESKAEAEEVVTIVMYGESSGSGTMNHCRQVPV